MNYLMKLISLECIDEQEGFGDEPFINVGSQRVAEIDDIGTGGSVNFNNGEGIIVPFQNSANINVFEEDLGYWPDRHDFIDNLTINGASYAGTGPQTFDIIGDGAHYQLTLAVAAQPVF